MGTARRYGTVMTVIHIAAALIEDRAGHVLLVRKASSRFFMQAGGKIEPGEEPAAALARELNEEIGLIVAPSEFRPLGRFSAPAVNEPDHRVDAHVFHLCTDHDPVPAAEIAEALWVDPAEADALPLAPLTRDHILPRHRQGC
ncbi:NUDIX domain-containing protein [Sphingomonas sanguinis]|uniref:NUDIX hydrolase n=1 Tax=Sphingomonas sp. LC-1 TaxID=3110957 RepID=UPI0021BAD89A|nr:NUDIX domain-containing protein [Sphingomonas sp. LC-1]MCT8000799.1 NUDIX domain-containing protein [Sphingomonas sp. LC-1]